MEPEFKLLEGIMTDNDIGLNYTKSQEHIPEIEKSIRFIKERFRDYYPRVPYNIIPKVMIMAWEINYVQWLNMFSPKGELSEY